MQFVHTTGPDVVATSLASHIRRALQSGKRVLWLVSGGSAIPIAVAVARELASLQEAPNLTIMQIDERYGQPGHANANWQALQDAGFACGRATCVPILRNLSLPETTETYEAELAHALQQADFHIGLFGIGADGHTAGMLPHSVASRETKRLVASYQGPDFMRVTVTTPLIAQLDEAIAYAVGEAKAPALRKLLTQASIPEQPAQALKQAADTTVYTDYQGG
jgi:6-phosphogluconolactonase/glucosamine-6-phosphate isomerase/deaminase